MSEKFKGLKIVKTNLMGCNQERQEIGIMWKQKGDNRIMRKQRRKEEQKFLINCTGF
jgi:hypothetical protein